MSETDSDRARAIFMEAVDWPAGERDARLALSCDDDGTRQRVLALLAAHDRVGPRFMHVPSDDAPPATPTLVAGQRIGRYEIQRVIASGGMGTVYEALQANPHRVVALKVLRPGIASSDALRRFRQEAEILGRLKHAGIAQIHDAETFDEGAGAQPYFAMEYVDGEPLTRFAESHALPTRERLELFSKVCGAVHYAHLRGVSIAI